MAEKNFIETTVGRLKVTTVGAGAPIVLWHSLFADERSWERVAAAAGPGSPADPGHGSWSRREWRP